MLTSTDFSTSNGLSGDQMARQVMKQAARAGLNAARTWAHTNHAQFPFQKAPGQYETAGLNALDLVIENARRRGIRLILSFADNWKYYNGVDQYIDWSRTAAPRAQERPADTNGDPTPMMYQDETVKEYEVRRHTLFYTDPDARRMFKDHIAALTNHVNSYSGRKYKDDPTILGWDLLNEPRCETWLVPECDAHLQAWLDDVSPWAKRHAPRQLILVGSEGFFEAGSPEAVANPQDWATQMGQNYTGNTLTVGVDVAGMHVWPNNWERTSDEFLLEWIESHVTATARDLAKPLLLEEFGKRLAPAEQAPQHIARLRDHVYELTYEAVERHITAGSALAGSLFWRWNLPMWDGEESGEYGVDPGDSTFAIIQKHARFIAQRINSRPPHHTCNYDCWVPAPSALFGKQTCLNVPRKCDDYWDAVRGGKPRLTGPYFVSKAACCQPGLGAYEAGCTMLAL